MDDSAAVAGLLWDDWLPAGVRRLIAEGLPGGEDDARRLVVWLSGVHDIGKATPAFACQVDQLADRMRSAGLEMGTARKLGADRKLALHGLAGLVLLQEWLEEERGWSGRQSGQFAVVVGGHHGVPPEHGQIKALLDRSHLVWSSGVSRAAAPRAGRRPRRGHAPRGAAGTAHPAGPPGRRADPPAPGGHAGRPCRTLGGR
jgi:CRISPR-associated endonuclease/helicase Cas3